MNEMNNTPKPDNFMVWAILSTLFCCLPIGIVAIIKANSVDGLWFKGDKEEAISAADDAKKWTLIAAAVGIGFNVLCFIFMFVAALLG